MKTRFRNLPRLLVTGWLCTLAALASSLAGAQVHAPYAPFTATVNSSSTVFNTTQGFNGGAAGFGESWGWRNPTPGTTSNSGAQYFSATFQADSGFVFSGVSLGFEGWSFANPDNSWVSLYLNWDVIAGSDIFSGSYAQHHGGPQGGGGGLGLPLPDSNLTLNNVSSFTVEFVASMWGGSPGSFGDGLGAGLGFSSFVVGTTTVAGSPPITTPIPEPETYAMLLAGLALLGFAARRRKQKEAVQA